MPDDHRDHMSDRIVSPTHRRFDREWHHLRIRPSLLRHAAGWRIVDGSIDDLDTIVDMVRDSTRPHVAETTARRLVELAADDDLAARTVLQALLPDLVVLYARRRCQGWRQVELGDLLTTGWIVVRTYNPARRPSRITRSLVSDVDWREYRSPLRRKADHRATQPTDFEHLVDDRGPSTLDELIEVLRAARDAGLQPDELDLVRRFASGDRSIDVADRLGVTPRTIRNRRDRIVGQLRELTAA